MSETSFESFVERRLGEPPRPSDTDFMQLRYLVGAGEVMCDILVGAAVDSDAFRELGHIVEKAIANGDPVARVEMDLLLSWTKKKMTGDTRSIADLVVTDDDARLLIRAYRALIAKYVGLADVKRLAILDAILTARAASDPLAATLKAMLESGTQDLSGLVAQAIEREVRGSAEQAAQSPSADSTPSSDERPSSAAVPAKSGCYVATAVYGSYDCPEVRVLRRFRDQSLSRHWPGRAFISAYYRISPRLVCLFGARLRFSSTIRRPLDVLVQRLQEAGYSESPYVDTNGGQSRPRPPRR